MYRIRAAAYVLLASGMVFSSSCSTEDVQTVLSGIRAVGNALDSNNHHEDISFGDWLMDEFG